MACDEGLGLFESSREQVVNEIQSRYEWLHAQPNQCQETCIEGWRCLLEQGHDGLHYHIVVGIFFNCETESYLGQDFMKRLRIKWHQVELGKLIDS